MDGSIVTKYRCGARGNAKRSKNDKICLNSLFFVVLNNAPRKNIGKTKEKYSKFLNNNSHSFASHFFSTRIHRQSMNGKFAFVSPILLLSLLSSLSRWREIGAAESNLLEAVASNDAELARKLMSDHDDALLERDRRGRTPMRLAVEGGNVEIIELLLKGGGGSTVDERDEEGIDAVEKSYATNAKIKSLILTSTDALGRTPLHRAVSGGDERRAGAMLENGAAVEAKCNLGQTPLMLAAAEGHLNCIRLLLDGKAEINARDNERRTALYLALKGGWDEAAVLLLEKGAIPRLAPISGTSPLSVAVYKGCLSAVRSIVAEDADELNSDHLMIAVHGAQPEVMRWLLSNHKQLDVNYANPQGLTCLMVSTMKNHTDISLMLIANQADVNVTDVNMSTPCLWSAYKGNVQVLRALINARCDVQAHNRWHHSPLTTAVLESNVEVVKLLLESGAKINEPENVLDSLMKTLAVQQVKEERPRDRELILILLEYGIDLNKCGGVALEMFSATVRYKTISYEYGGKSFERFLRDMIAYHLEREASYGEVMTVKWGSAAQCLLLFDKHRILVLYKLLSAYYDNRFRTWNDPEYERNVRNRLGFYRWNLMERAFAEYYAKYHRMFIDTRFRNLSFDLLYEIWFRKSEFNPFINKRLDELAEIFELVVLYKRETNGKVALGDMLAESSPSFITLLNKLVSEIRPN